MEYYYHVYLPPSRGNDIQFHSKREGYKTHCERFTLKLILGFQRFQKLQVIITSVNSSMDNIGSHKETTSLL